MPPPSCNCWVLKMVSKRFGRHRPPSEIQGPLLKISLLTFNGFRCAVPWSSSVPAAALLRCSGRAICDSTLKTEGAAPVWTAPQCQTPHLQRQHQFRLRQAPVRLARVASHRIPRGRQPPQRPKCSCGGHSSSRKQDCAMKNLIRRETAVLLIRATFDLRLKRP